MSNVIALLTLPYHTVCGNVSARALVHAKAKTEFLRELKGKNRWKKKRWERKNHKKKSIIGIQMEDRNRVYQGRRAWGTTCLVIYIVCYVVLSVCDWRHVITFSLSTTFFFFFFYRYIISLSFPFTRSFFVVYLYMISLCNRRCDCWWNCFFFFNFLFDCILSHRYLADHL